VEAARMAVEEFGPTVLGKPIEIVSADHQMKTDVGTQIVRDWFDNGKVDAVADIPNSGVAIAVHNMVGERTTWWGSATRSRCCPVPEPAR
jgi:branched-chain amino acid transport system substrate-binding protein